jgi:intracellular multiplication protein IcmC
MQKNITSNYFLFITKLYRNIWRVSVTILLAFAPFCIARADDAKPSDTWWSMYFPDLTKMMEALNQNLPAVVQFLAAFAYVMGVWFVFSALQELRIFGQARTMMPSNITFTGPLTKFCVGIALIFLPGTINMSMWTLWGQDSTSILQYPTSVSEAWQPLMKGTISLVRVLGYTAFIRGMILYTRATKQGAQPGMASKATTHIIGGILAINIVSTINILKATLGFMSS